MHDALLTSPLSGPADTSPSTAPAAAAEPRAPFGFLAVVAALTLAADLLTKLWAVRTLTRPESLRIDVLHDHMDFVLRRNAGGAFSFLYDQPEALRKPFFVVVSVVAIAIIVLAYRRLRASDAASKWGFAIVLGGALGNLLDRIRDSAVTDFIRAHAAWGGQDHEWPVFNVADIAIVVGVILLAIGTIRRRQRN